MSKTQAYPSDLTDEQWRLVRPLLPKRKGDKPGRPHTVDQRDLLDAIFYMLRCGCPWRLLPHDSPPWGTVSSQFYRWRMTGRWQHIRDGLRRTTD
jgi:putative transposase